jgi:6-phosphofructokinase 1
VLTLFYHYGVKDILGFRYGYMGLIEEFGIEPIVLTPEFVTEIHQKGGTVLSSSRGNGERTEEIADTLEKLGVNILFTIGGDGTQKGALAISRELTRRNLPISVIGIPKTIDNDLSFAQKSFGFETAVEGAQKAVDAAHTEAKGAPNGIGLVKVMGRQSGFIAAHTVLANNDVNFVLIPEVPFELDGPNGLLAHLERRLLKRQHAVILAAEGAGQDLFDKSGEKDASGNKKLLDIGLFLKEKIKAHFEQQKIKTSIKYIDPSYIIRAVKANPNDSLFCARLANGAVHAAMSGKTEMVISLLHNCYVHVPMTLAVSKRHQINPDDALWRDVLEATGQPPLMINR